MFFKQRLSKNFLDVQETAGNSFEIPKAGSNKELWNDITNKPVGFTSTLNKNETGTCT